MAFDTRVVFSRLGCRRASLNKREQRALVSSCTEIQKVKFRGGGYKCVPFGLSSLALELEKGRGQQERARAHFSSVTWGVCVRTVR